MWGRSRLRMWARSPMREVKAGCARFDVPTTAARFGNRLYLVNARFTSPQTPRTAFSAVAVSL